jgi:hypothetical protein
LPSSIPAIPVPRSWCRSTPAGHIAVPTSSSYGATWTTIDVGEFDGGPLLATDLDGDGRYEFAPRDNAFLYAFACYACSTAPLEVLAVESGAVKNVTTEPRFKQAHEGTLKFIIEEVPDGEVNGFLAGYVGEKILLGEGKEAWDLMLAYSDKTSDWGLETCDQAARERPSSSPFPRHSNACLRKMVIR